MLRIILPPLGFTALLLAGCDPSPPQAKPTATAPKTDYLAQINKLTPQQRNATFYRAIEDASFICERVATSQSIAAVDGHPAWDVGCGDRQHWTLVLLDNGIIQVLKGAAADAGSAEAPANKM